MPLIMETNTTAALAAMGAAFEAAYIAADDPTSLVTQPWSLPALPPKLLTPTPSTLSAPPKPPTASFAP